MPDTAEKIKFWEKYSEEELDEAIATQEKAGKNYKLSFQELEYLSEHKMKIKNLRITDMYIEFLQVFKNNNEPLTKSDAIMMTGRLPSYYYYTVKLLIKNGFLKELPTKHKKIYLNEWRIERNE